jgi:2-oxoglutarate dehydrogenase E2 component (dihydrolipoamide succinyltransferase)
MTDVVMPQMGESIAEGTIVRWIKKVGDRVERDEPLFEISTDKVDAEIPSPVAGVIAEIRAKEGETVPVNSVVAVIGSASAGALPAAATARQAPAVSAAPAAATPDAPSVSVSPAVASAARAEPVEPRAESVEEVIRQRSSPLVRKIAQEHNVDISKIAGTGIAGRVTKDDILGYLQKNGGRALPAAAAGPPSKGAQRAVPGTTAPMSVMRRKIAEHMLLSRRTSAHVHSVFEIDFARVAKIREAKKAEYERAGGKLTYLSFILKAVVDALRAVPVVNASIDGDSVVYHKHINVGIAVALDWGLIVPVVKDADEKNLLGLSRAVSDLAARARSKQLKPDEVSGGTFTITNPGVFGALFGMPIINQPQVAILGVGNIEKRPVVIDDAIAIRPRAYLSLGYDHRIIDGAVADEFMSHIKDAIEGWEPEQA